MKFKVITHPQRSEAWFRWRFDGIGSSDASSIMGFSKFKSRSELLTEKLTYSFRPSSNDKMFLGIWNEMEAHRIYRVRAEVKTYSECIEHKSYSWLRASLDGLCIISNKIVEIKCGEGTYNNVGQSRSVPLYLKPQLQHILATSGFEKLDLWCWHPGKRGLLRVVERDNRYIDNLLDAEQDF